MKIRFFYSIFFTISIFHIAQSQNIKYKYFRPSITQLYTTFNGDPIIQEDLEELSNLPLSNKIDMLSISTPNFPSVEIPVAPKKNFFNPKKYKTKKSIYISSIENSTSELMYQKTRQMLATWFARDVNGYMSESYLSKMAGYTAVQQDMTIDKASEISRISNIAYDLIPKSYFVLYDVKKITSWKEYYDEMDAKLLKTSKKLKVDLAPMLRKNVGYFLTYDVLLYKLDWNDTTSNDFYNNYYVDTSYTNDKDRNIQLSEKLKKIQNYENLKIGANLVSVYNIKSSSTDDIYSAYSLSQMLYELSLNLTASKSKPDYEKLGDEAYKTGNFGAAKNLYNKANSENPKNTSLKQKIKQSTLAEIQLFQQNEKEYYNDIQKVEKLKRAFTDIIKNTAYAKVSSDEKVKNDFKITTAIIGRQNTQLKVPIGTKEDLAVGQRYVAYEILNNNGVEEKKYVGYARVTKKMVQNNGKISGILNVNKLDSKFEPYSTGYSLFTQQAGNITKGCILELEPDKGQKLFFEYNIGGRNNRTAESDSSLFQCLTLGYGFDARKIWSVFGGSKKMGPENVNVNFHLHYFINGGLGGGISVDKEIYTGLRGLHIIPSIYVGYPMILRPGIGIGYNFKKNLSLSINKYFIFGSSFGLNFKYRF
jgi:hypothetical protein